ncbi:MAG: helix-turn-helix transcriptional regulator [Proteiniphilum sp.]|jgi:DNA-binding CsgD family transcriptional regulator|nr:helix-turn-helix transcriptional regulator [Proteiniphilum sp.]
MMTANAEMILTRREAEVAELFAWGASKKEVADRLYISQRTVENHSRNIYTKTGCGKVNELSAWWFCTCFNISFELSPMKRRAVALFMLLVVLPTVWRDNCTDVFTRRARGRRAEVEFILNMEEV